MAAKSYRTLVMAMRHISKDMIKQLENYQKNMKNNRKENSLQIQKYFETDLTFLGITAVEDTLQLQAPQTIQRLSNSGLKIWICTGDKYETTLGVAKACSLIRSKTVKKVAIIMENQQEILESLSKGIKDLEGGEELELLAISGIALAVIENNIHIKAMMLQLVAVAKTTIFVRMAPSQKVSVIEMAKKDLKMKVLAIGDGYNDQLMLQAADVGFRINHEPIQQNEQQSDDEESKDLKKQ